MCTPTNKGKEEAAEETPKRGCCGGFCGLLNRNPLISVVSFAIIGICIGLGLSFWEPPEGDDAKEKTIKWIGLIGDLFIRSLKCVILPLVFINVTISVVDMMNVGRAGSVGWRVIVAYLVTTLIASVLGIIAILAFKPLFTQGTFAPKPPPTITLGCDMDGSYLTEFADGSVACSMANSTSTATHFIIEDLTGSFVRTSGSIASSISLSDTVYDGVFTKLFADNAFFAFTDSNFAAVVFMAIVLGVALSSVLYEEGGESHSYVVPFFKELDRCLLRIINWIIVITPWAVLSLIAAAVGGQDDLIDSFANVGYLVLACVFGFAMQFILVHGIIFYFVTKMSPFWYFKHIVPAQTMAFACASSAATIPVTLRSVRSTGIVPESILKFVIPLGATINMDGSAIYFPCACIWLAVLNGVELNAAHFILLIVIATIGSAGTAPVPASGLVLIVTAYNTVFGTTGIPDGFSFVVAIDWFLDRLITVTNVSGDASVCGMISKLCPVDEELEEIEQATKLENGETFRDDTVKSGVTFAEEDSSTMAKQVM